MKKLLLSVILCSSVAMGITSCGGGARRRAAKESEEQTAQTEQADLNGGVNQAFRMHADLPLNLPSEYAPAAEGNITLAAFMKAAKEEQGVPALKPHITENTKKVYVDQTTMLKYTQFHDGLAAVQNIKRNDYGHTNNTWGFIDREGNVVIDFIIKTSVQGDIPEFYDGVAWIDAPSNSLGNGMALIDKNANVVVHYPDLHHCTNFVGGVATGYMRLPNPANGNKPETFNVYLDTRGNLVFPAISKPLPQYTVYNFFTLEKPRPLCDGLSAYHDYTNNSWGFIDAEGNIVIPAAYREVQDFSEGLAAVKDAEDMWWFIDTKGSVAIEQSFRREPKPFQEGVAIVSRRDGQSSLYIDKTGAILYDDLHYATPFIDGKAFISKKIAENYLLDRDMQTLSPTGKGEVGGWRAENYDRQDGVYYFRGSVFAADTREPLLTGIIEHEYFREGLAKCLFRYKPDGPGEQQYTYGFVNPRGEIEIIFLVPEF